MEWRDEGLVIGVRRHGETSAIVELMTRHHGRHAGVVRGGRSRRLRPVLQIGNSVEASWRARLNEHLGTYALEGLSLRAADVMASGLALEAVACVAAMLRLLPERDPHRGLFEAATLIVDHVKDATTAGLLIVRFEVELLSELGFGLDLSACAATGATDDLRYVSPRSGRAVSRAAGAPYAERLFALPPFLGGSGAAPLPSAAEILEAFAITGHFLARHVFEPRAIPMPDARLALLQRFRGSSAGAVLAANHRFG